METFSYFLYRNGCSLYFAVLEQPEEWRSVGNVLSWESQEGKVYSAECSEISGNDVYLWGTSRDKDMVISRPDFGTEQSAIEKEAQVHRLLAKFIQAGGFSGKRKAPKAPGVVTTFAV